MIRALRRRGLEPVVTLHHFTNPAWFSGRGGWLRRDAVGLFARYVEQVATRLGAGGALLADHQRADGPTCCRATSTARGRPSCARVPGATRSGVRNLARAHVAGCRALHRCRADCRVGFAHSAPAVEPCDPEVVARPARRVRCASLILNRAFFAMIGAWPDAGGAALPLDLIGLNYYTRTVMRSTGWRPRGLLGRAAIVPHHRHQGALSSIGWEIYPRGLKAVVGRFAARHRLPLLITENGIATGDENLRTRFLLDHLASLAASLLAAASR